MEKRKITELKPALYNPRKMSDYEMKNLMRSIESFGFVEPVVINKDNTIIGGHQRVKAAEHLGIEEVPVIQIDLPKNKEKALNLALNKIHGEWNEELLAALLKEMDDEAKLLSGFSEKEIAEALQKAINGEEDDFDTTPPEVPKTKLGDLYKLGEHRLLCGDATKKEDVERLMDGEKADMVFTDPPYNTGMSEKTNKDSTLLNQMFNDDFSEEEWGKFLESFCKNYCDFSSKNCVHYVCMNWKRNGEIVKVYKEIGFEFSNLIVWDKIVHGLGGDYKYTHEFINVFKKGKPLLLTHVGDKEYQDIWHIQRKKGRDDDHATKKPIEVVVRALNHSSQEENFILDLFGGSGSTLIACEQTNRKCRMMEIDPKYCDVIVARYEKFSGKKAEKIS